MPGATPDKKTSGFNEVEFSNRKREELKRLFPDMKSSELERIVKKEVESAKKMYLMTAKSPAELAEEASNFKASDIVEEDESKVQKKLTYSDKKIPVTVRRDEAEPQMIPEEQPEERQEEQVPVSPHRASKRKAIKKKKSQGKQVHFSSMDDHKRFFKYYDNDLMKKHPKWTANQRNTIIKLLWKKRSQTLRQSARKNLRINKAERLVSIYRIGMSPLTGRKWFGDVHRMREKLFQLRPTLDDGTVDHYRHNAPWRHLPAESKRFWKNLGEGGNGYKKILSKKVKKISSPKSKSTKNEDADSFNPTAVTLNPLSYLKRF